MSDEVKKTMDEWQEITGLTVMDPDGWRTATAPARHVPITREEFDRRAFASTVRLPDRPSE